MQDKKQPLYIQLYDRLTAEIISGHFPNGFKLPSRRDMAEKSNLSQNTVDSAYKMLADTGYAKAIPRQGYIVTYKRASTSNTPWEQNAPESIVFSPNGIDTSHINRGAYARIVKNISYNDGKDIFSYIEKGGETELRMAISKYLYSFRSIKCSPEQIIIGAGQEYQLRAFASMMQNSRFVIENPCDGRLYTALYEDGKNISILPPNAGNLNLDELLRSNSDIFIIDADSRFPRGTMLNDNERAELLNSYNGYIIEIGSDSELCSKTGTPLYSLDTKKRVIYLGSFSRSIGPAIRTSYMVLPYELMDKWKNFHTYYYALSSKLEQLVLAEFIDKGYYTKHCRQMRRIYSEKKLYLAYRITEILHESAVISSNGGTYITVSINGNTAQIKQTAKSIGIKLLSLNSYNINKYTSPLENDPLILGIGDLSVRDISRGLRLLKENI